MLECPMFVAWSNHPQNQDLKSLALRIPDASCLYVENVSMLQELENFHPARMILFTSTMIHDS